MDEPGSRTTVMSPRATDVQRVDAVEVDGFVKGPGRLNDVAVKIGNVEERLKPLVKEAGPHPPGSRGGAEGDQGDQRYYDDGSVRKPVHGSTSYASTSLSRSFPVTSISAAAAATIGHRGIIGATTLSIPMALRAYRTTGGFGMNEATYIARGL